MNLVTLGMVLFSAVASLVASPWLPERMPSHWNFQGQIDGYMNKPLGVWLFTILLAGMWVLFGVLPQWDPKKDKYRLFEKEWRIIQAGIMGFFVYLQMAVFYVVLNPGTELLPIMFVGLGGLFVLIGNYLSKVRQNYFIGIKVPWTLNDEDNWNKTHRYASWCFVLAGVATLAEALFFWYAPAVIFGSIMLAAGLPIVYSFLLYKKMVDRMKYVYIGLVLVVLVLALVRGLSGEDDWVCREGQWVRHGNPSNPMPESICGG